MSTNRIPQYGITSTLELSVDSSPGESESQEMLLPRSAWDSQLTYLRVIFRAKKALDRIEKAAGM